MSNTILGALRGRLKPTYASILVAILAGLLLMRANLDYAVDHSPTFKELHQKGKLEPPVTIPSTKTYGWPVVARTTIEARTYHASSTRANDCGPQPIPYDLSVSSLWHASGLCVDALCCLGIIVCSLLLSRYAISHRLWAPLAPLWAWLVRTRPRLLGLTVVTAFHFALVLRLDTLSAPSAKKAAIVLATPGYYAARYYVNPGQELVTVLIILLNSLLWAVCVCYILCALFPKLRTGNRPTTG